MSKRNARNKAKLEKLNEINYIDKRAKRIAKRKNKGTGVGNLIRKGVAKIRGKKGAAKDKAVQTQVAANEAKAKKDTPLTKHGKKGKKSPLKCPFLAMAPAIMGAVGAAKSAKK